MDFFAQIIDFILHMEKYLDLILKAVGGWTYAILWVVIFI